MVRQQNNQAGNGRGQSRRNIAPAMMGVLGQPAERRGGGPFGRLPSRTSGQAGQTRGGTIDSNRGQANAKSQRQRPNIERKFAEQGTPLKLCPSCEVGKKYHELGQVRYWSLAKISIQVLMTCIVVNCKKIAKLVSDRLSKLPARPA